MRVVVELVDVRKRYRGVGDVLAGVTLSVTPGSVSVVLGTNGSGKSTLLRVAAGCAVPTTGVVRRRAGVVGFLPAQFPASSRLSVHGYLQHLGAVHGAGREAGARGEAVLEELGFSGSLAAPVSELSTGNAQKVGLAQALGVEAGLLVLDEPWTALDDAAAEALSGQLVAASRTAGVLIADHSGRGREVDAAVVRRLERGRLVPVDAAERVEPVTGPVGVAQLGARGLVDVVVRCPVDAGRVVPALPATRAVECRDRVARVRLDPAEADTWMAAALAGGCSVRSVRWPGESGAAP